MNRTLIAGAAAGALLVLTAGVAGWTYLAGGAAPECGQSRVAGADIGGPFTLVDEAGRTVTEADVIDRPTLIYFGYTFCPDVCPPDNARNGAAVELLEARGVDVRPVFVTVDPARDTAAVMAEFTDHFHPRMLGLTGSAQQVDAAAEAYRVYYRLHAAEPGDDFYLVDHSTFTYLMLPGEGVVDFFRRDATPEDIADRVACTVAA